MSIIKFSWILGNLYVKAIVYSSHSAMHYNTGDLRRSTTWSNEAMPRGNASKLWNLPLALRRYILIDSSKRALRRSLWLF